MPSVAHAIPGQQFVGPPHGQRRPAWIAVAVAGLAVLMWFGLVATLLFEGPIASDAESPELRFAATTTLPDRRPDTSDLAASRSVDAFTITDPDDPLAPFIGLWKGFDPQDESIYTVTVRSDGVVTIFETAATKCFEAFGELSPSFASGNGTVDGNDLQVRTTAFCLLTSGDRPHPSYTDVGLRIDYRSESGTLMFDGVCLHRSPGDATACGSG